MDIWHVCKTFVRDTKSLDTCGSLNNGSPLLGAAAGLASDATLFTQHEADRRAMHPQKLSIVAKTIKPLEDPLIRAPEAALLSINSMILFPLS